MSQYKSFEWETDFPPAKSDIAREQEERGYHPAGYGNPMDIKTSLIEPGRWFTTWNCYASCD